jgi:hypothetical protein
MLRLEKDASNGLGRGIDGTASLAVDASSGVKKTNSDAINQDARSCRFANTTNFLKQDVAPGTCRGALAGFDLHVLSAFRA